jgi:hypothetical protein
MDMISSRKTNFFEKKVAEYQKSGVMNTDEWRTENDALILETRRGAKSERKLDI